MKIKNKVQLVGNLGNAPQVTQLPNGTLLVKFSLATNETYLNKEGERVTQTQWHNIVTWGKTASIAQKFLRRGNAVAVEGKLMNRSYEDANGVKKYITEIQANELLKLSPKA